MQNINFSDYKEIDTRYKENDPRIKEIFTLGIFINKDEITPINTFDSFLEANNAIMQFDDTDVELNIIKHLKCTHSYFRISEYIKLS